MKAEVQDARISTGLPNHPKTKKLRRRLGGEGAWHLVCLFLWAAGNRSDGDLSGMSADDIELAADWEGEEGAFVQALVDVRFLDGAPGQYTIHDWSDHNPWAAGAKARSAKGRWAALVRQHGRAEAALQMPDYARRLLAASSADAGGVLDDSGGSARGMPEAATGMPDAATSTKNSATSMPQARSGSAPSPNPLPNPNPLPSPNPEPVVGDSAREAPPDPRSPPERSPSPPGSAAQLRSLAEQVDAINTAAARPPPAAPRVVAFPAAGGDVFVVGPGWAPGEGFMATLTYTGCAAPAQFVSDEIPEFVLYWRDRGERKTQAQWEHKLRSDIRRKWARYQQAHATAGNEPSRIPNNWHPATEALALLAERGVDEAFALERIGEFVLFWRDVGEARRSWNAPYVDFVMLRWSQHRPERHSTWDNLTDMSWAAGITEFDQPDRLEHLQ